MTILRLLQLPIQERIQSIIACYCCCAAVMVNIADATIVETQTFIHINIMVLTFFKNGIIIPLMRAQNTKDHSVGVLSN